MERCIENAEGHCKSYPLCYGCNAFRKPTNADRIRAMSDEELADGEKEKAMKIEITKSCEDSNKIYVTFPDRLRLVFENGEYVGWYICGEGSDG